MVLQVAGSYLKTYFIFSIVRTAGEIQRDLNKNGGLVPISQHRCCVVNGILVPRSFPGLRTSGYDSSPA